jgi:4-aminobutyrate--pyruvate transaminase
LILRAMGGNSMALCPPLIIDESQVDELIEKLGKGLDGALAYVQQEQLLVA